MRERYLVRCTAATGRAMAGIYAAGLTATGMVATWKMERATRFESKVDAASVASRLAKKFAGTIWTEESVEVGQ
ncbi:MAG TPA: hypothetical protein DHV85_07070 [Candidatus Accumulibacter sp.]|nr:hypothetical protein [Accumulibacter sp.]